MGIADYPMERPADDEVLSKSTPSPGPATL